MQKLPTVMAGTGCPRTKTGQHILEGSWCRQCGAEVMAITLPLPPRCLHPNASHSASRGAKIGRHKAKQKYRGDSRLASLAALNGGKAPRWERARIHATFHLGPQGRKADADNLVAWIKSGVDSLADAGIIVNDSGLVWLSPSQVYGSESRERKVVLVLEPLTSGA
jgi:Holliday junction resolvase RusA-like endonuclease